MLIGMLFPQSTRRPGHRRGQRRALGKALGHRINDQFMKELGATLTEGTSALFVLVRKSTPDKVLEALKPFRGQRPRPANVADEGQGGGTAQIHGGQMNARKDFHSAVAPLQTRTPAFSDELHTLKSKPPHKLPNLTDYATPSSSRPRTGCNRLAAVNLQAADADPVTTEVPAADLKELNDPTILSRRVWLETEWNKFENGTNSHRRDVWRNVGLACFGESGLGRAAEAAVQVSLR
jgi:hypothetical protein